MAEALIPVRVAYALPGEQTVMALHVAPGTSPRQALRCSGLAARYPDINPQTCVLGVFGRVVGEGYRLRAGDRVEVYRPLLNDPREARRDHALGHGAARRR